MAAAHHRAPDVFLLDLSAVGSSFVAGIGAGREAPIERHDVIVVGAGITGLSAALDLHRAGRSVLVLEAADRVGGVVRSEAVPGVGVIDLGPQTVRSADPELFRQFEELNIETERLVAGAQGKSRYVVLDGELVELPHSPPALASSKLLSMRAKMRLLSEPLRGTRVGEDESIRDFFTRRLGPEVAERLVDPFVSGVYAGDPSRLSMEAVFPELKAGVDASGSLLKWGLGRMRGARGAAGAEDREKRSAELFSFPAGLARWPSAMADALGADRVRLGHRTVSARRDGPDWVVTVEAAGETRTLRAGALVLTAPAGEVARIVPGARGEGASGLADIPYSPVSTVHLAYRRADVAHPLAGFGYLCPSREGRPVLGVLWISSLFPERVESDRVLLTTFVGGARQSERAFESEATLIDVAYGEHERFLGVRARPVHAQVQRWERAIPQYEFGHLERVAEADRLESEHPGLHLAGAWRDGVSVPDCWKGGRRVAREILASAAR